MGASASSVNSGSLATSAILGLESSVATAQAAAGGDPAALNAFLRTVINRGSAVSNAAAITVATHAAPHTQWGGIAARLNLCVLPSGVPRPVAVAGHI